MATHDGKDVSARALLLGLLLGLCCYYANLAKDSYMDDFRAFYLASASVHDGLDPYRNHVDVSERYADALWLRADSRWLYPPSALWFVKPLARAGYKWSKIAFGAVMAMLMAGTLWQMQRRYPRRIVVLLALFLSLPMFMNIDNGQVDCLILALVLAAFYLEDGAAAGVLLGIAISIKFAPVLLLLWFVCSRRWRTALWSGATFGVFAAASLWRWGPGYWVEFRQHVRRHVDIDALPAIAHTFTTVTKIGDRFMVTADGVNSYQHDICGYLESPLRVLGGHAGEAGLVCLLAFTGWLFWTRRGRGLGVERGFFLFLVFALLANPLLWTMGLVACFPLTLELVDSSPRPNLASLLLLVPLFLTKQVVGNSNFTLWILAAVWCVWRNGWLREGGVHAGA